MKTKLLTGSMMAAYALLNTPALAEEVTLDPIVVSADFREKTLSQTTNSVTIIGEEEIYDKASQSFIEALSEIPNVNFSTGASKAKYIQIRGIGERSQYETPINPSVGLIIDGIDFSYATLGATLFDVNQVEVLKGPQGTTFGANGLAGVVSLQSNEPTKETEGHIEATVGNYNTKAVGAAIGGTLVDDVLLGRFSIYKNTSDGYMENSYLNRDDTQNIDELTAKAQLRWMASDNHTIDLNVMHVNIDNGYDAWTLDNSWDSHSDQPGQDTQKTNAFALKSTYELDTMRLISKISHSSSDMTYSYDEDWSYVGEFDASLWPYMGFDEYNRDQKLTDIDIRLVSDEDGRIFGGKTDWTIGAYAKKFEEDLDRYHPTDYGAEENFDSSYESRNIALYTQLDTHIDEKLTFVTGLRVEDWNAEYSDSHNVNIDNDEVMVGGKIGLNYAYDQSTLLFANISRGYKPGGVNPGSTLSVEDKTFATETLWNFETGVNSSHFDNTLKSRLNLFYGKRNDMQVKLYDLAGHSFTDYLSNAAKGSYYGLESQLDYYPNDDLHLYSSIGLLKAEFDEYSPELEGRAPAQSPKYQYNIGFDYVLAEAWIFKTNVEGRGSYYFSNTHDQKSEAYALLNSSLEYTNGSFSATIWVRNLTDEEYAVRGFFFPNNPGNGYIDELYTQKGSPRTFGLTVAYDF
ncbi:TonB-dependent receptor [Sulfurovum sp. XGS-02]|uniref:TonB-dependent receptor n=1 Tax=Sulfurovum sp. XGS-02 TaxID=2925411 RepID=UPI00206BE7E4|nr:TonB-dependent receptor [Sulfurovum sp. XGS-02]UPT78003.1 TonB-dependent receptor [Sulfurovum sp. XGS-02]